MSAAAYADWHAAQSRSWLCPQVATLAAGSSASLPRPETTEESFPPTVFCRKALPCPSSDIAAAPAGPALQGAPYAPCRPCPAPVCIPSQVSDLQDARRRPLKRVLRRHTAIRAWLGRAARALGGAQFHAATLVCQLSSEPCRPALPRFRRGSAPSAAPSIALADRC